VIRKLTPGLVVSVIAGTGQAGYSGDGRAATAALLSGPSGIAVDSKGGIYFSDQSSRIRRIGADGTITTYAGNASLSYPTGLVATADGSLYVADSGNFRVLVVSPSEVINTIAGGGSLTTDGPATQAILPYPVGLAVDSLGRIVIATNAGRQVRRWAADGTITTVAGVYPSAGSADHVPATSQTLLQVYGIAVDSLGDVFVSDSTDNRIWKIAPDDSMSTFAGDSQFGSPADGSKASILGAPWGLAVDANGNLLVGAGTFETVFRLTPGGISTRVAGGNGAAYSGDFGSALQAAIGNPMSVAAAGDGGFYISDPVYNVIRKVTAQGEILTYAGTATLNNPQQIAVDSDGRLYIADSGNNVVRKVSPGGVITTVAGNGQVGGNLGDGGQATAAELVAPRGVAIDREMAALFIAEGNRIRRVDLSTGLIHTIAGGILGTYGFAGDGGPAFVALLANPGHLAVGLNHDVYFCDDGNLRVRKLTLVREDKKRAGPQPE
jgi:sugar lactone lactonase YvrE